MPLICNYEFGLSLLYKALKQSYDKVIEEFDRKINKVDNRIIIVAKHRVAKHSSF